MLNYIKYTTVHFLKTLPSAVGLWGLGEEN